MPKQAPINSNNTTSAEIDFSVVIALLNHGGHWEESIRSWCSVQDYARERYEVIVVSNGKRVAVEDGVRRLLGTQDSLLITSLTEELDVYDFGCRRARGKFLFFAEAHSVGEANCLSKMMKYLDETGRPGGMCHSYGVAKSYVGKLQEVLFQKEAEAFANDHWHRIALRGTAILRSTYFEYGGFPRNYSIFGDRALDIDLFRNGVHLGYVFDSIVKHHNVSGFPHIEFATRLYTHGECVYRRDYSELHCNNYIGDSAVWRERFFYHDVISKLRFNAQRRFFMRQLDNPRGSRDFLLVVIFLAQLFLNAQFGYKILLFKTGLRMRLWKLAVQFCHLLRLREWAEISFLNYLYLASVAHFQAESIATNPPQLSPRPGVKFSMEDSLDEHVVGFHLRERTDLGTFYRWTQPNSVFNLTLPNGNYELHIGDAHCRPVDLDPQLAIFFNKHELPVEKTESGWNCVIRAEHFSRRDVQHLLLVSENFKPSKFGSADQRDLGVPISKIELVPVVSAAMPSERLELVVAAK